MKNQILIQTSFWISFLDVVSEAFLRVWSKVAQALFNLVALVQMPNRYKMNLPLTVKRMTNKKGFCGQK